MNQYIDPDADVNADWSFSVAFAQDQAKYAFPIAPMQPCTNVACRNRSSALYCSPACLAAVEPEVLEEPEADEAYYQDPDSSTTLGLKALADDQRRRDGENLAALACGYGPQAAAAVVPVLPESPCSVNTYVELAGRQVQVTLRGIDEAEVLARLEALLSRFPVALPTASRPTPVETGEGWCYLHSTQMRWNPAKHGEAGWWSHKAADGSGWCKGRAKGQRAA